MKKIELANKELEEFLRKENVLTEWVRNAKASYGRDLFPLAVEDKNQELIASFDFAGTPEGFIFWYELNNKYELQIEQSCQK